MSGHTPHEQACALYRRAQRALEACSQVIRGTACLTPFGAAYLGVPFVHREYREQLRLWEGPPD